MLYQFDSTAHALNFYGRVFRTINELKQSKIVLNRFEHDRVFLLLVGSLMPRASRRQCPSAFTNTPTTTNNNKLLQVKAILKV